jgi:hypothetical protein
MNDQTPRSRRGFLKALLGLAAVSAVGGATLLGTTPAEAAPLLPTPTPAQPTDHAPDSALPKAEPTQYYYRRRRYYRPRRRIFVRRRVYRRRRYYY